MKIAFLIPTMQAGGAERVAAMLCAAWAERGDRVTLMTYAEQEPFYVLPPSVRLMKLGLPGGAGKAAKAVGANVRRVRELREILQAERPDVLVCFMPEASIPGVLAARSLGIPVVACERSDPRFIPSSRALRLMRDMVYPLASAITVQTDQAAAYFKKLETHVIPNPVSKPDTGHGQKPDFPFIAAMGRLSPEKNFDALLRAFALLYRENADLHLVILGEGEERDRLEALVQSLEIQDRVMMPGLSQKPFGLLHHAEAYVMPSLFEGFPNALCEAMAVGLPVVAGRDAIGVQAIVRDGVNGLLTDITNPEAIAESVRYILKHSAKAEEIGRKAARIIEDLSMNRILGMWDSLLRSI